MRNFIRTLAVCIAVISTSIPIMTLQSYYKKEKCGKI